MFKSIIAMHARNSIFEFAVLSKRVRNSNLNDNERANRPDRGCVLRQSHTPAASRLLLPKAVLREPSCVMWTLRCVWACPAAGPAHTPHHPSRDNHFV
ncbi:unnamed protein product [Danaus chrysippus]|uniref:(African queen) hypothetical protein n=1 Tax=Danaus chrysippus TaxID=151541 RepID=A0A8J2VT37_9NEOP|nr:unnamed protein product [Danaus chrysippus]